MTHNSAHNLLTWLTPHKKVYKSKFTLLLLLSIILSDISCSKVTKTLTQEKLEKKECHFLKKYWLRSGVGEADLKILTKKGYSKGEESRLHLAVATIKGSKLIKFPLDLHKAEDFCGSLDPHLAQREALSFSWANKSKNSTKIEFGGEAPANSIFDSEYAQRRPAEFFFYVCDCDGLMTSDHFSFIGPEKRKKLKIEVSLVTKHVSGKYHSGEQHSIFNFISIFLILYFALLVFGAYKIYKYHTQELEIDYPILLTLGCVFIQLLSLVSCAIHNISILFIGEGYSVLDVASRIWHMAGDLGVSLLLVLLAQGFGTFIDSIGDDQVLSLFLMIGLIIARYALEIIGYFVNNHEDIYHIYQGWTGHVQLLLTLFVFLWFNKSYYAGKLRTTDRFKKFAKVLYGLGCLLFCLRPALVLATELFDPVDRHIVALVSSYGAVWVACFALLILLTNKRGVYQTVSFSRTGFELVDQGKTI